MGNLALQGNNPSRIMVYRAGADIIARLEIDFPDMLAGTSVATVRFGRNTVPLNFQTAFYQGSTLVHVLNTGVGGAYYSYLCSSGNPLVVGGNIPTGSTTSYLAFEVLSSGGVKVSKPWPTLTTTQRDALAGGNYALIPKGSVIWNSTLGKLQLAGTTAWETVTSG
jgi:hypothetical protein